MPKVIKGEIFEPSPIIKQDKFNTSTGELDFKCLCKTTGLWIESKLCPECCRNHTYNIGSIKLTKQLWRLQNKKE